ncbi:uncharacterized protein VDAG_09926 [Verticillium dahliae VdLs.17]|uniref:Uncharacterized protein n=1 Tax=Verticillium dahliae (strain VdLs.17 / ATCC MYA-4575 / FGSC 10137) TaxID=498257 RepID=G2XIE4_VERDV|nr:uncharacterized protein VDAG_09926 [Verticillium dahliae VdLs.17]EGY19592.1 hypothetical protein VDAG_09926 [Verticillium dahliae VdLs.17]KAH6701908.1 hypothetical protein EV126DRAFT_339073 [Verticillium dahliae]
MHDQGSAPQRAEYCGHQEDEREGGRADPSNQPTTSSPERGQGVTAQRNLVINRCREALGRQQTTFIDLPRPPPAPRKSLTRRTTHLLIADHLGHGRSLPCSTALTADVDAEEITWLLVRREWSSHDVFTHSADESRVVELSRSPTRLILELITSKWLRVEWKCETPLTALTTNDCPNRTLGRRTL